MGLGLSFYYACFANDVYSISSTVIDATTTQYRIVDEKNEKWELGIASLLHFGIKPSKNCDWFALNLVTGSALSITNKIKPRIIIGGGISFGRKQLLSINALYLGGYVDKKSEVFSVEDFYTTKPEQVTVSKPDGAFGLSLGYIYRF